MRISRSSQALNYPVFDDYCPKADGFYYYHEVHEGHEETGANNFMSFRGFMVKTTILIQAQF